MRSELMQFEIRIDWRSLLYLLCSCLDGPGDAMWGFSMPLGFNLFISGKGPTLQASLALNFIS